GRTRTSEWRPQMAIFTAEGQPFHLIADGVPAFEGPAAAPIVQINPAAGIGALAMALGSSRSLAAQHGPSFDESRFHALGSLHCSIESSRRRACTPRIPLTIWVMRRSTTRLASDKA